MQMRLLLCMYSDGRTTGRTDERQTIRQTSTTPHVEICHVRGDHMRLFYLEKVMVGFQVSDGF